MQAKFLSRPAALWIAAGAFLGCSGNTPPLPGEAGGNAGDNVGGSRAEGGSGNGTLATAGQGGNASSGGSLGTAGTTAGHAGAAGQGSSGFAGQGQAGMGGSGGGAPTAYACTEFLGPNVTGEWFAAGFEDHVKDANWQVKSPHHALVEDWADSNHAVWLEECEGNYYDCETRSACVGATPDRIIFVTAKIDYLGTSQAAWEDDTEAALQTIKAKYAGVRHIELMTFVRSPPGQNCGEQTTVSPNLDAARLAVAARSQGFVSVAPDFVVPHCDVFASAPHMTPQGNAAMGELIGKHYAKP